MRLHVLLKRQESQACSQREWVMREASNQDALQEAGTFRYPHMGGAAQYGVGSTWPPELLLVLLLLLLPLCMLSGFHGGDGRTPLVGPPKGQPADVGTQ